MFSATLRGMVAHKLRLVLTTASIALGVAFLAGTLILTDTMKLAFDQLFGKVSSGTDAVVRTHAAYDQSAGVGLDRAPIKADILDQVRKVDGVRAAEGSVTGYALLTDTKGRAVLTKGGAPTQGYSLTADKRLRGEVNIRSGHAPTGPGEVAIDATSADKHHIPLGSHIKILFRGPTQEFTVVGTVGYGKSKDLGGTTSAYFDVATAQRVLGTPGMYDSIGVSAARGVTPAQLAKRIDAVLPQGSEAVTGAKVAKESSDAITKDLTFVTILFSIFAGVALFVGSFIIWNTFTMIVTQRSREIALLRAVGATRRQVLRSLMTEALLLGVLSSAVGVGLGIGVARGLTKLMDLVGFTLPSTAEQIAPRTIWVSLLVGTIVTVVAALVPARRATKVLPIEALREATPGSGKPSRLRGAIGFVLTGLGLTGVLTGLYSGSGGYAVLFGIVGVVVGVMTILPLAVRPLALAIGGPLRWRGISGELAQQNAMRNPRRTSSTAAALMIGLTLVVSMGVFAASLKASFGGILDDSTKAQLFLSPSSSQAEGFSPEVAKVVATVPGVKAVSAVSVGQARFNGGDVYYTSIDPTTAGQLFDLQVSAGSIRGTGENGVMVRKKVAKANGLKVGDTVPTEFAATGKHNLVVTGIFDRTASFVSDYVISLTGQDAYQGKRLDSNGFVLLDKGANQKQVQDRITAALADHPDAQVLDLKGFNKVSTGFIDQLLTFVTVMLLLAVFIALLGIVNTLALSVYERTRELGLLRAVGMTKAQVRAMVRWESVVISLIGALAGA
ncbi:MAG: ABC transporter permease, partial [Actinomycetota bacterium]|nr:ABC transporter permease [Actinomycetota bacterium]